MFDFKEEIARYRKSLEVSDLSGGVSGDEVRDILDIAKELMNARDVKAPEKIQPAPAPKAEEEAEGEKEDVLPGDDEPQILAVEAEKTAAEEA